MVKLAFKILVPMSKQDSWDYFSDFSTMAEWDPNVEKSQKVQIKQQHNSKKKTQSPINKRIGQQYHITVNFKGSKSVVQYTVVQCEEKQKIRMTGSNSFMTFDQNIYFFQTKKEKQTIIQYISFIELRGPLCLFLPCIRSSLYAAGQQVKEKMINKSRQLANEKKKLKK